MRVCAKGVRGLVCACVCLCALACARVRGPGGMGGLGGLVEAYRYVRTRRRTPALCVCVQRSVAQWQRSAQSYAERFRPPALLLFCCQADAANAQSALAAAAQAAQV
jgi:hypothetical protein